MNVLVDMNLTPRWVRFFASNGISAVHGSTVGAPTAPDSELMKWARDNDHVVFTHDLDFSALVATIGAIGPSVIQIRTLDVLPDAIGVQVVAMLRAHEADLVRGAILTFDGATARVRILPIR